VSDDSITARALAFISNRGTRGARGYEIEAALGLPPGRSSGILRPHVLSGALVTCKVLNPDTGQQTNEYRKSVSGGGAVPMTPLKTPRPLPRAQEKPLAEQPAEERAAPTRDAPVAPAKNGELHIGAIEKGIPIPMRNNRGRIRAALLEMAIGDSRLMTLSKQAVLYAAKAAGVKVTIRAEGEGSVRVWRIEP
jgi:hypothetical protein